MSGFRLFLPIGKVDEEKRTVYGTLTAEVPDKTGEIFDYASGKPAVQAWSDEIKAASGGKSLGNVRAMHGKTAAGKFTDIVFDDRNKRIEGAAKIIDDDEWKKVVEGVYTGFSIGGSYTKRWQDPDDSSLWRFTPELSEISLVDNPCVPTATFDYIKADGTREVRKFTPSIKEDSMDPKALAAAKDALSKGTATDEQKALIKAESDALLKDAREADAGGTATEEQKALLAKVAEETKAALVKDGKAVKPKTAPVQFNKWQASDGTFHDSKREAEIHNIHLEKQAELAPGLAQMNELLLKGKPKDEDDEDAEGDDEDTKRAKAARREKKAKDKEAADAEAEKKRKEKEEADKAAADLLQKAKEKEAEDNVEYADPGYQNDKKKRYPVDSEKHIRAAWSYINQEKNHKPYTADQVDKIKAKIVEAWKAKIDKEGPPSASEKSAKVQTLSKGLHHVARLACLISELEWLHQEVENEQEWEKDTESTQPEQLKEDIASLCMTLRSMVEEETEELFQGEHEEEILEEALDEHSEEPMEMSAALAGLSKAVKEKSEPLVKSDSKKEAERGARLAKVAELLAKAGARHSKADAKRVQDIHDAIDKMHKCMGDMAEKCADMHKEAGEAKNNAIDLGAKGERYEDEGDDDAGTQKMSKVLELNGQLQVEVGALTKVVSEGNTTLLKAIDEIQASREESQALREENAELTKRVENLEGQPAAGKGHARVRSNVQDKSGANSADKSAGERPAFQPRRIA